MDDLSMDRVNDQHPGGETDQSAGSVFYNDVEKVQRTYWLRIFLKQKI